MDIDKNRFKNLFPGLSEEMENEGNALSISSTQSDTESEEMLNFEGYNPNVIDFLQRCDTKEQVESIIDFMERRKEISHKQAELLRRQFEEKGIRSFGLKKGDAYYVREAYK